MAQEWANRPMEQNEELEIYKHMEESIWTYERSGVTNQKGSINRLINCIMEIGSPSKKIFLSQTIPQNKLKGLQRFSYEK